MSDVRNIRIGFVGVNTWHAEAFSDVLLTTGPASHVRPLDGAELVALWGGPDEDRAKLAKKTGAREYTKGPGELIGQIDLAFIMDDTGGGERHRELAEPFLRAGIPVIVDKPMTLTISDAKALFALAAEHNTPIMSSSALRFSEELTDHTAELEAVGQIRAINVLGPGEWYYYGIHATELLLTLVPSPVDWVHRYKSDHQDVAVVGFADGRLATIDVLRDAHYIFTATVYGTKGWISLEIDRNYEFYRALLQAGIDMARTGVPPVMPEQTLEVLRVLHAGIKSEELGRAVRLTEVDE